MTSTLPEEVREAFERFVTCEFTTVAAGQQPVTWPVTPYYSPGGPCIDVTTGLGYPKKADDARRHPKVSLLFSDPTGSGIDSGIRVLVQGTAEVDDENLKENAERYMRETGKKLPATTKMHPPKPLRGMFAWYYSRIYVHVRPERVFIWPDGDMEQEPQIQDAHLEEVRSGHSEEPPEERGQTRAGDASSDPRLDQLSPHSSGVLSWLAPDGFPAAIRMPFQLNADRTITVEADPAELPLLDGRACLTVHHHSPDFTWQRNMQVRGDLTQTAEGWRLIPRKVVGGFELPEGRLSKYRDFVRKGPRFYRTYRARMRQRP